MPNYTEPSIVVFRLCCMVSVFCLIFTVQWADIICLECVLCTC